LEGFSGSGAVGGAGFSGFSVGVGFSTGGSGPVFPALPASPV